MNDLISRETAIELIHSLYPSAPIMRMNRKRWEKKYEPYIEAEKALEMLPSVESEIIRCKDCRFFKRNIPCTGGHYNGCEMWLDDGDEIRVMTDDYCSKALPKEGEQNEAD